MRLVWVEGENQNDIKTDPWTTGTDPWASFAKTAIAKRAKKEEEALAEDIAEGFGLQTVGASAAASSASGMPLSAEAAAIIATVNSNTDQKVAQVTGRLDRHEGLIVDLGARVVSLE